MKKTLSLALSLIMLILTLSVGFQAFAEAEEITTGKSITVSVAPTGNDESKKVTVAKFSPTKDGWYEFMFAQAYKNQSPDKDHIASCYIDVTDSKGATVVKASAKDKSVYTDAELIELRKKGVAVDTIDLLGLTFDGKKGETYYLSLYHGGNQTYTSDLSVNKHNHKHETTTVPCVVTKKGSDATKTYGVYETCGDWQCKYSSTKRIIEHIAPLKISPTSFVYDGNAKLPTVTIKTKSGVALDTKYYTIAYSNNVKIGTGKAVITFSGDYTGVVTLTFKINPKGTYLTAAKPLKKGFKAVWKKRAKNITGYQIQYATNKKFTKGKKTVTVKGAANTYKKITKLTANKKYYVRVRTYKTVSGKKYYSKWSKSRAVTTK
jgi:hypothetical protein